MDETQDSAVRVCFYLKKPNFSGFPKSRQQHPGLIVTIGSEGFQDRLPQHVPLWRVNYFELKAVKTLVAHAKLSPLP